VAVVAVSFKEDVAFAADIPQLKLDCIDYTISDNYSAVDYPSAEGYRLKVAS